ncbi:hypothetical protein CYLTODRAFT_427468 [Cylindrobasidium torrendii FP15055 ss-10]|uniref:Fungal-type protein kinase domain-containing protein n=1 Tax=Cylindrobasidium torrendii FP15055 ss-10 TaxID=1314674 RepID=A0A0D7AUA3_9AGAR|nr:hypothetical protein CYLTODRAFT_427468 [Cylindrobasidium torrendii FP15055 ss-10]
MFINFKGYLIALLKGYMHRDTSIGNLLRLFNEVDRKPFSAKSVVELLRASRNDTETATDDVSTWTSIEELASGDAEKKRLVDNAKALERALQTLNISDKCRAVWSDADMAANLNNYFERERNKSQVSGTEEFQSWEMRYAIEQKEPYAHSPLDDLHSFFWTTLCATTNNKNQVSEKKDESVWRRNLRGTWSDREGVMFAFSMCNMDSSYSPMLVNMQSFMGAWKIKIDKLLKEGHAKAAELSQSAENTGDDILDMYKRLMFRGVQEYFDLILEHKESLGLSV